MANVDFSRIAGNISAANALTELGRINKQLSIHQTRLASGKRINTAEDDPAGLTIATKLNARSEGLKVALNNIGDAKNLLAVAESGMGRINDILLQMRNKAEAGASDTLGAEERNAIREQMVAYTDQIDNLVANTTWNSTALLDGTVADMRFQTGADATDNITLATIANVDSATLLIDDALDTIIPEEDNATADDYATYLTTINTAMTTVNTEMTKVGALMGRLTFKEDQVMTSQMNVEAAYSRIMNADMAYEQVQASKLNILQQTSTAMLAQANSAPQFLLSLFR